MKSRRLMCSHLCQTRTRQTARMTIDFYKKEAACPRSVLRPINAEGTDRASAPARRSHPRGGTCHNALTVANEPLVGEHERIVSKLNGRQFLRVHHHLERFNTLNRRGGSRRIGGRGGPYSEANRDQGGGKGKQGGVAHLSSPVQSAQPHHAVAQAVRWGVACRTLASNDVMAITKWSISGSEKG